MPTRSASRIDLSENKLPLARTSEIKDMKIKKEVDNDHKDKCTNEDEEQGDDDDDEICDNDDHSSYPISLPLEVITTIEPFNYAYPYLKNMSNGVLTHRNIFTEQEREVLKNIVDKYREIVDTRSRTREIYLEKQNVWQQIVEEYNSTENILIRTEKELKKCWDNMKYRARQAEKEQLKAGTGTSARKSPDPHQIACSAVQAALEKMLFLQTQTGNVNENDLNYLDDKSIVKSEILKNWNSEDLHQNKGIEDELNFSDEDTFDDDDQPVVKKARQESPKLSSILLGDAKRSPYHKGRISEPKSHYSICNSAKVAQMNNRLKKTNNGSYTSVSVLPKGLSSSVSIVNIPNPNQSASSQLNGNSDSNLEFSSTGVDALSRSSILGGGITFSPQKITIASTSDDSQGRQMIPNGTLKKSPKDGPLPQDTCYGYFPQSDECPANESASDCCRDKSLLEEKLLLQRLEFSSQEHTLRMKVLEKQLQAFTNESQFWALRMKMLRNNINKSSGKNLNAESQK